MMVRRQQRGVALVTAILMVTLATIAAVAMATRQQLDIRRTGNLLHGTQAVMYTEAAESWARVILQRDAKDGNVDTLEEDWARQVPASLVEGGSIRGRLEDMQGRFNLNSLVDKDGKPVPAAVDQFKRLLVNLELDEALAAALRDWIDSDIDESFPDGAEDNSYLLLQPGYRVANRPLVSVTELMLVKGFDRKAIDKLLPYVSVLPEPTPININTAPLEVLRSLARDLTTADAEALAEGRGDKGYENVAEFMGQPALQGKPQAIDQTRISVESQWFQLLAVSDIGQAHAELSSLIQRVDKQPRVVSRERLLRGAIDKPEEKGS